MQHFLKGTDFSIDTCAAILERSAYYKRYRNVHDEAPLAKQAWGLLFFKKSTRTRISFQVGVSELGGTPITANATDLQLSRGESIAATAHVLSRYLHGLIIRAHEHKVAEAFAKYGSIPVVNALTDFLHPCQIYADLFTLAERWGNNGSLIDSLRGRKLVFLGDTACNVANSWLVNGLRLGMHITLAGPPEFQPQANIQDLLQQIEFSSAYTFTEDAIAAVKDADAIYTDVWVSMGQEQESKKRIECLRPYTITADLLAKASPQALFLHCLPAHPGYEVTQAVLDGSQSIIFDQAENRLHVQKAILATLAQINNNS